MSAIPAVIEDHQGDRLDGLVQPRLGFVEIGNVAFLNALIQAWGVGVVLEQDQVVFGGCVDRGAKCARYAHLTADQRWLDIENHPHV